MLSFLSRTWVIVAFLVATLAVGYSFLSVMSQTGGVLLDSAMSGAEAKALLAAMTAEQKSAHFWGTVLNDTAYPIAYGGFLIGAIWRFAGNLRKWFVVPAIATPVIDLFENTVQALALKGNESLIGMKDFLTPAKFGLFWLALLLLLVSLGLSLYRRFRPAK